MHILKATCSYVDSRRIDRQAQLLKMSMASLCECHLNDNYMSIFGSRNTTFDISSSFDSLGVHVDNEWKLKITVVICRKVFVFSLGRHIRIECIWSPFWVWYVYGWVGRLSRLSFHNHYRQSDKYTVVILKNDSTYTCMHTDIPRHNYLLTYLPTYLHIYGNTCAHLVTQTRWSYRN